MQKVGILCSVSFVGALLVAACSGATNHSGFDDGTGTGTGPGGTANGEGGTGVGFGTGGSDGGMGCVGIGCKAVVCPGGGHTTITGQVYDPAGKNPLYNVIVYIPTDPAAALPPITSGVTCDKCGATALNPVTSALTDENGMFTLSDVPVMPGVPVVIQVGKWRKKISFDVNTQCAENKITDKLTLPKNGMEGDMPQIAIAQGAYDALECLVRGMGVSDSEFTAGAGGTGHVHLFKGIGGSGMKNGSSVPDVTALWNTKASLSAFDIVALSCEGQEDTSNKSAAAMQAMHDYAEAGGRIFATHYHYVWFKDSPQADWKGVAKWGFSTTTENDYPVMQNFPKGISFAKWLTNVGASMTPGNVDLDPNDTAGSLSTVGMQSQPWVTGSKNNTPDTGDVKYFSFNAPLSATPDNQCGRAVFGDIHVSGAASGGKAFPDDCPAAGTALTAQQKALEFLFFDLSSCVQSDQTQPMPPK